MGTLDDELRAFLDEGRTEREQAKVDRRNAVRAFDRLWKKLDSHEQDDRRSFEALAKAGADRHLELLGMVRATDAQVGVHAAQIAGLQRGQDRVDAEITGTHDLARIKAAAGGVVPELTPHSHKHDSFFAKERAKVVAKIVLLLVGYVFAYLGGHLHVLWH